MTPKTSSSGCLVSFNFPFVVAYSTSFHRFYPTVSRLAREFWCASSSSFSPCYLTCFRPVEFMRQFPSTCKGDGDAASNPSPLLIEWAKATLITNGSWRDALAVSLEVSIFLCAMCFLDLTLGVSSLRSQNLQSIVLFVNGWRRMTMCWMQVTVSSK